MHIALGFSSFFTLCTLNLTCMDRVVLELCTLLKELWTGWSGKLSVCSSSSGLRKPLAGAFRWAAWGCRKEEGRRRGEEGGGEGREIRKARKRGVRREPSVRSGAFFSHASWWGSDK